VSERYAIYFVPREGSLVWRLGCEWHGRDPASGERFTPALPDGLSAERYEAIVASARRYGFHATLKPPFALKPGTTAAELATAVEAHARHVAPFAAPALQVARLGGFLALTLSGPSPVMDHLCADCVRVFDRFRAPPTEAELAARRKAPLTPRQDELLKLWGYPYVMDEFRFHMTLTTSLEGAELALLERHLRARFRPVLAAPLYVERIALFREPEPGAPFTLMRSFALGAGR
jgi:putative phosphonate metabolism protein